MIRPWSLLPVLGLLAIAPGDLARWTAADPIAQVEAHVKLVSGTVLRGRVTGSETIQGNRILHVTTDLGQILVPAKEVKERVEPKVESEITFFAQQIRVVRIRGKVERQTGKQGDWLPVTWKGAYGEEIVNFPNALVRPGDRVRTGRDGELDLQPHKDVWIRIAPNSEVEFPLERRGKGTLSLLRGRTINDVISRPNGETFRVQTTSAVLGVQGTRFGVSIDQHGLHVPVLHGKVESSRGVVVSGGHALEHSASGESAIRPLTAAETESLTIQIFRLPVRAMVLIEGGEFLLGDGPDATHDERGMRRTTGAMEDPFKEFGLSNVSQQVRAHVTTFLMDGREVTNDEFSQFAQVHGLPPPAKTSAPDWDRLPARPVTWRSAAAYARWVGGTLPSEAQFEVAARGPQRDLWPWGNELRPEHRLLPVGDSWPADAPTVDVTPRGVRGLVSGVPEWTRDWVFPAGAGRYVGVNLAVDVPPPEVTSAGSAAKRVRGSFLSARFASWFYWTDAWPSGAGPGYAPGFRCVAEFQGP